MLSKIVFLIGAKFRNPTLWKRINASMHLKVEKSIDEGKTLSKVNSLFAYARANSEFYKEKWKDFDDDLKLDSLAELAKLPIITKTDLVESAQRITIKKEGEKYFEAETSGSTGQALKFWRDEIWDSKNREFQIQCYAQFGVFPWERNGYFWGYSFSKKQALKIKALDFIQNRFRLFDYKEESVKKFVLKLKKASYLHGYSSMIYEVAIMAKKMGFQPSDFPKLKMIKGTSEKIYPLYQSAVQDVFGKKIISEYGAAETGLIAFECTNGHMHVNHQNVIVEVEHSEIIVTNLNSFSFPIIRYKLGDVVKIAPHTTCQCGNQGSVILDVEGRVGKKIVGLKGTYPSLTLYYVFKNLALKHNLELQYQAYQKSKGALELRIPTKLSEKEEALLLAETARYFENDINIALKQEYSIHSKKGKLKDFITELE